MGQDCCWSTKNTFEMALSLTAPRPDVGDSSRIGGATNHLPRPAICLSNRDRIGVKSILRHGQRINGDNFARRVWL